MGNMKTLTCGCCGCWFELWEGYEDQDQDEGFGICQPCQGSIGDRNEDEWDKGIAVLRSGLNEANQVKFDTFDRDFQKALVNKALDDKVLTWSIGGK
jgi:hypothetical protein